MNQEEADQGAFVVTVTNRKGIALEVSDQNSTPFEKTLLEDPDIKDVDYSVSDNVATIEAYISKESGKTTAEKVDEYNKLWAGKPGSDVVVKSMSESSGGGSSTAVVTLTGDDFTQLKSNIYKAMEQLKTIDGVLHVSSKLESGATEARVQKEADEMIANMDLGSAQAGTDFETEFEANEMKKVGMAMLAAVFLVFLVMAMQFESIRFSIMVMISIPFAFIGSVALMFVSGETMNSGALLGGLMLAGIVVNDGILFVDTANGLKNEYPVEEALARTGEIRIRPILMTTLTTVLSMVPLVLSTDSGASLMDGMGLMIIGGLMASTILILILLPTFYMLFMGKRAKLENRTKFPVQEVIKEKKKTSRP